MAGGSALNSGQVGSTRAAQYIAARYREQPLPRDEFLAEAKSQITAKIELGKSFLKKLGTTSNVAAIRRRIQERMTRAGAHIRSSEQAGAGAAAALSQLKHLAEETQIASPSELGLCFQNYDLLLCQYVYLSAIKDYIEKGGKSRFVSGLQSLRGVPPAHCRGVPFFTDGGPLLSPAHTASAA